MTVTSHVMHTARKLIARPFGLACIQISQHDAAQNTQNWKNFHTAETVSAGAGKRKTNLTEIWT